MSFLAGKPARTVRETKFNQKRDVTYLRTMRYDTGFRRYTFVTPRKAIALTYILSMYFDTRAFTCT